MNLNDYSTNDLKEEIERRETLPEKPSMLKEPNLDSLQSSAKSYIEYVWGDEYFEDSTDYEHYIFEDVIQTFYGENIFDKINKML